MHPGVNLDLSAASSARLAKCTPGTVTIYGYLFASSVPPDGFNPIAAAENLGVFQVFLAVSVRSRCLILLLLSFFIELSLFGDHTLDLFLGSTEASSLFRGSCLLETSGRAACQSKSLMEAVAVTTAA